MDNEAIAQLAHAVNCAYRQAIGEEPGPGWDEADASTRRSALAGVEFILANPDATPEQSHEAWLAQKATEGFTFGRVKDLAAKTHPCFVPYAELPLPQRAKDHIFGAIVRTASELDGKSISTRTVLESDLIDANAGYRDAYDAWSAARFATPPNSIIVERREDDLEEAATALLAAVKAVVCCLDEVAT